MELHCLGSHVRTRTRLEIETLWTRLGRLLSGHRSYYRELGFRSLCERAVPFQVLRCNPGDQSWDFKQSYRLGSLALRHRRVPSFEPTREAQ